MNKQLKGAKQGSNQNCHNFGIALFFLLFSYSTSFYSQVPINGFCKTDKFNIPVGYSKLVSFNLNDSTYLFLYSIRSSNYSILKLSPAGLFEQVSTGDFLFVPTNVVSGYDRIKGKGLICAISRPSKKGAIISVNQSGKVETSAQLAFKSPPDAISSGDSDGDSNSEFLISGPGFDGLSFLKYTDAKLIETKILKNISVSQSSFVELNSDAFVDIAAFDLAKNELNFYYNFAGNSFSFARSFPFYEKITSIKCSDLNSDKYPDVICATKTGFNFIFGDQVSSFKKNFKFTTECSPDKFVTGDFNADGLSDIAYFNTETNSVYVNFQQTSGEFYSEIAYIINKPITDISSYNFKKGQGLIAITGTGEAYNISRFYTPPTKPGFTFSTEKTLNGFFDFRNDKSNDFFYYDKAQKSLIFLLNNNAGIPSIYFSIPSLSSYGKYALGDGNRSIKTFCFFNELGRSLEFIRIDFLTFKINRQYFYLDAPVKSISFQDKQIAKNNPQELYVSYAKDNEVHNLTIIYINDKFSEKK